MTSIVRHLKGNAVAYLALFVALGGTSYAAINLPASSVGTRQLRNGSVTSGKLANGAVTLGKLNSKTIAGHIALWAQIRSGGQVASSSPRASVVTYAVPGNERVSWNRSVSGRCMALASPANVGPDAATATTTGPYPHKGHTDLVVSTFNGGGIRMPEAVNVVVICP